MPNFSGRSAGGLTIRTNTAIAPSPAASAPNGATTRRSGPTSPNTSHAPHAAATMPATKIATSVRVSVCHALTPTPKSSYQSTKVSPASATPPTIVSHPAIGGTWVLLSPMPSRSYGIGRAPCRRARPALERQPATGGDPEGREEADEEHVLACRLPDRVDHPVQQQKR